MYIRTQENDKIFKSGSIIQIGNTAIQIGGIKPGDDDESASITVRDSYNIDLKIDDGIANSGKLYSIDGDNIAAGSCSARKNTVGGADYITANLNNNNLYCFLKYFLGY